MDLYTPNELLYPISTFRASNKKAIKAEIFRTINSYNSRIDFDYNHSSKLITKSPSKINFNARSSSIFMPKKSCPSFVINKNRALSQNLKILSKKLCPLQSGEIKERKKYFYQTYDCKTKVGTIDLANKANNQDSYFCIPRFQGQDSQGLYGVCDGHGTYGHLVSAEIKEKFPKLLEKRMNCKNHIKDPAIFMKKSIISIHKDLVSSDIINTDFSGSTLVAVLIKGCTLICASVGDSRAVLARKLENGFTAIPLSQDHKPGIHNERRRIENSGGRIDTLYSYGNSVGPLRVWIGDQSAPGLAMSRSIGDKFATEVGVIPDPEIKKIELTKDDKFIIIASDGVWDVISNEEAVTICRNGWEFGYPQSSCECLLKEAHKRWIEKESNNDDITAIVVFLKSN